NQWRFLSAVPLVKGKPIWESSFAEGPIKKRDWESHLTKRIGELGAQIKQWNDLQWDAEKKLDELQKIALKFKHDSPSEVAREMLQNIRQGHYLDIWIDALVGLPFTTIAYVPEAIQRGITQAINKGREQVLKKRITDLTKKIDQS